LLSDGTVLIASGWFAGPLAQIYDPASESFSRTGDLSIDRHSHTATLLLDGSVLIAGGNTGCCTPVATAEVYHPQVVKPAPRLLSLSGVENNSGAIQHSATYEVVSDQNPALPGEIVIIYCTGIVAGNAIPPQVAIGGRMTEVLWFGDVSGFSGLNQINARIPNGVAAGGGIQVRLNYMGRPSNAVSTAIAAGQH
jgi:hypothetical protein